MRKQALGAHASSVLFVEGGKCTQDACAPRAGIIAKARWRFLCRLGTETAGQRRVVRYSCEHRRNRSAPTLSATQAPECPRDREFASRRDHLPDSPFVFAADHSITESPA